MGLLTKGKGLSIGFEELYVSMVVFFCSIGVRMVGLREIAVQGLPLPASDVNFGEPPLPCRYFAHFRFLRSSKVSHSPS